MSTLTKVLRLPDQDSDASVACRIVSIHLFHSDKSILLTVVLIDRDGKTFEAKAWSANKAYYVYFNFKEGQYVELRCPPALFTHVDERFSRSDYEIQRRNWFLEPSTHSFQPKSPFPACYDIAAFYKSQTPVKSVVAMFLEMGGGPKKYGPNGRVVARGHYTKFKDSKNRIFQVLLWEIANRKFKFPLRDCKVGDYVLLPYAREQPERYRSSKIYTITTLYPPVVQSQCVDVTKITKLLKSHVAYECVPFNPYE